MHSTSVLDQVLSEPPCDMRPTFAKSPIGAEVQVVCMEYGAAYSLWGEEMTLSDGLAWWFLLSLWVNRARHEASRI